MLLDITRKDYNNKTIIHFMVSVFNSLVGSCFAGKTNAFRVRSVQQKVPNIMFI